MVELTPEQGMAMVEVRELLRLADIDVDTMSDEDIIGFVNRGIKWIADLFPDHHPALSVVLQMAQAPQHPAAEPPLDSTEE